MRTLSIIQAVSVLSLQTTCQPLCFQVLQMAICLSEYSLFLSIFYRNNISIISRNVTLFFIHTSCSFSVNIFPKLQKMQIIRFVLVFLFGFCDFCKRVIEHTRKKVFFTKNRLPNIEIIWKIQKIILIRNRICLKRYKKQAYKTDSTFHFIMR